MNAEQKKHFLNQLLDQPIDKARPPFDSASHAARLLWQTGAVSQPRLRAEDIWKKHTAREPGRQLRFPRRFIYPLVAAAALVIAAVSLLPGLLRETTMPVKSAAMAGIQASYRNSARVFVQSAENYSAREEADALVITAQAIEARIDFKANAGLKSVVIRTPRATFTIIGTSIAVSASPESSTLHVVTGKVQVETAAGTEFVSRGEVWSVQKDAAIKRPEAKTDLAYYLRLGEGAPVPAHEEQKELPERKPKPPLAPLPSVPNTEQKATGPGTFKPDIPNRAPEGEKATLPDKRGERGDDSGKRAEREARREDREARRAERQAGRSERHK